MDLEDQYRFQVEGEAYDDAAVLLTCDRCDWDAQIQGVITLRELNERAQEHAEVCR